MKAKLKRLHSPDVDLNTYWPDDPNNFGFLLQAMIGPEDREGEESFDIQVCTPDWLRDRYLETGVFGYHYLIVFEYDFDKIKNIIERYCERCVGESWQEIAHKLARIGRWEFEDYIPKHA